MIFATSLSTALVLLSAAPEDEHTRFFVSAEAMVSGWTTPGKGQSAWREQKISTNYGARLRMMFTLEDLPLSLFGAVAFSKEYGVTADSSVILGDQKVSLSAPRAVDILSGLFGLHVFKNFPILLRAKADNRLYTLAAFERDDLGEVKSGALQHQDKRIGADLYYTRLVRAPSVNWFGVGARFLRQRLLAQIDDPVVLALPAVGAKVLVEVALVVQQTNADQRKAKVRGRFQVIPGEDAEAARIGRQTLRQREFKREIGDRFSR